MELTARLPGGKRRHVESRLREDLVGWLTTVRPDGRPETVPVWFLIRDDETVLLYSRPGQVKLRNLAANPHVTLVLDGTDVGRDVVRLQGDARRVDEEAPASDVPAYVAKYRARIVGGFGTPERFAELYSVPIVVSPTAVRT